MTQPVSPALALAERIAALFGALPQVEAVALGGSLAGGSPDPTSDIDLYVYLRAPIPLTERQRIVEQTGGASRTSLDLPYWGPGDEWYHAPSGIEVDIVYFEADWMQAQIDRLLVAQQASLGYSTCFWYTLLNSRIYYDAKGWFSRLQAFARQDYPEPLRRRIIALNHSVLRGVIPAYAHQVEKAVRRGDRVSTNHRVAALLASYFDVLFALNRLPHPGEKRLVAYALQHCTLLPAHFEADLNAVLAASGTAAPELNLTLTRLLDALDSLLEQQGFTA
jgi:predicted nucleotidyltransferase